MVKEIEDIEDKYNVINRLERIPNGRFMLLISLVGAIAVFYDIFAIDQVGLVLPTMTAAYHWTTIEGSISVATIFIGMAVGSIILGRAADKIGRRYILTFTIFVMALGSLITGLSFGNVYVFNLGRIVSGIGVGGDFPIAWAYVNEMLPSKFRGKMFSITYIIGVAAIPAAAYLVAYSLAVLPLKVAWTPIFYVGAVLSIPFFVARFKAPESPRYYLMHRKQKEADDVMRKIEETFSKKNIKLPSPDPKNTMVELEKSPLRDLFLPQYRRRTIAMIFLFVFNVSAFYGFTAYLPTILVDKGISIVTSALYATISYIGGIIGPFFMFALGEKYERRILAAIYMIVLAPITVYFAFLRIDVAILIVSFIINILLQASAATFEGYSGEVWPSKMRGAGTGLANGIGRAWNALSLFIIGVILITVTDKLVFLGIMWVAAAISCILVGVNTKNKILEKATGEGGEEKDRMHTTQAQKDTQ